MEDTVFDDTRALLAFVLGYRIRKLRKDQHLSQTELGIALGSQPLISLLENGHQLPHPDILRLLADRLKDSQLRHYADAFEAGNFSIESIIEVGNDDLLDALRSHRGKWDRFHQHTAIQLCEHYYTHANYRIVQELSMKIINNKDGGDPPVLAKAYFYYGSTFLHSASYRESIKWLPMAEKHLKFMEATYQVRLLHNLAFYCIMVYDDASAYFYARSASDLALQSKLFPQYGKTLGLLGLAEKRLGKLTDAKATLFAARDMCAQMGADSDTARTEANIAEVFFLLSDFTETERWALIALKTAQGTDLIAECTALQMLVLQRQLTNQPSEARTLSQEMIEKSLQTKNSKIISESYVVASKIATNDRDRVKMLLCAYRFIKDDRDSTIRPIIADQISQLLAKVNKTRLSVAFLSVALDGYRYHSVHTFSYLAISVVLADSKEAPC